MGLENVIFSKWGLIVIAIILIWLFGGGDFIMRNPILIFFGIIAMVVMGGKKR